MSRCLIYLLEEFVFGGFIYVCLCVLCGGYYCNNKYFGMYNCLDMIYNDFVWWFL